MKKRRLIFLTVLFFTFCFVFYSLTKDEQINHYEIQQRAIEKAKHCAEAGYLSEGCAP